VDGDENLMLVYFRHADWMQPQLLRAAETVDCCRAHHSGYGARAAFAGKNGHVVRALAHWVILSHPSSAMELGGSVLYVDAAL
jgi:hypothetical protein